MKRITSSEEYRKLFEGASDSLTRAEKVRDIELDLYWRRAAYFWAFSAAAFAGYFALSTSKTAPSDLLVYVSCLGAVFSCVWYYANRGGKYWQVSWEHHIDLHEGAKRGPLYKTTLVLPKKDAFKPIAAYPFSVSKLNSWLSLFVYVVWLLLVIRSAICAKIQFKAQHRLTIVVLVLTVVALIALPILSTRTRPKGKRRLEMEMREYDN